jgi:hypothetical protein
LIKAWGFGFWADMFHVQQRAQHRRASTDRHRPRLLSAGSTTGRRRSTPTRTGRSGSTPWTAWQSACRVGAPSPRGAICNPITRGPKVSNNCSR